MHFFAFSPPESQTKRKARPLFLAWKKTAIFVARVWAQIYSLQLRTTFSRVSKDNSKTGLEMPREHIEGGEGEGEKDATTSGVESYYLDCDPLAHKTGSFF